MSVAISRAAERASGVCAGGGSETLSSPKRTPPFLSSDTQHPTQKAGVAPKRQILPDISGIDRLGIERLALRPNINTPNILRHRRRRQSWRATARNRQRQSQANAKRLLTTTLAAED